MFEKVKYISPLYVIDAAGYRKISRRIFYENGKLECDSIVESITSAWCWDNCDVAVRVRKYGTDGQCIRRVHYEHHNPARFSN